jgi:hypothetical protein
VGGYYDAGDNVKFGLPMAFTVTMMSWSIIEYGKQMASSGELGHAMEAVKWGTDYFIKAHPEPNVLYGEVPFQFQVLTLFSPVFYYPFSLNHHQLIIHHFTHHFALSNSHTCNNF